MIFKYPTADNIIEINKRRLEESTETEHFVLPNQSELYGIIENTKEIYSNDIVMKATFLYTSIIACHLFKQGNHRTAMDSAILFLELNNYKVLLTEKEQEEIIDWLSEYEKKNDLERVWFGFVGEHGWNNKNSATKIKEKIKWFIEESPYKEYSEKIYQLFIHKKIN